MLKKKQYYIIFLFLFFFFLSQSIFADEHHSSHSEEYHVKAALIYNILKFIEIPSFSNNTLKVCVFGEKNTYDFFHSIEGKQIKKSTIRLIGNPRKISFCQVVFMDRNYKIKEKLRNDKTKPILYIGESDHFLSQDGIVNFKFYNGKIRFEINNSLAKKMGFQISSQLLSLAIRVK